MSEIMIADMDDSPLSRRDIMALKMWKVIAENSGNKTYIEDNTKTIEIVDDFINKLDNGIEQDQENEEN